MPKGETDLYERPRAVAQAALQPDRHESRHLNTSERELISTSAGRSGFMASAMTAVVSGGAVALASALSPRFRSALSASGKTALIVTPTAFAFWAQSHLTIGAATKDPSAYIESAAAATQVTVAAAKAGEVVRLPAYYGIANAIYTHPFKTIMGLAVPSYAALFYYESVNPATAHMLLSQRLIHTRVYGQAIAIGITTAVMAYVKTMEDDGGAYRLYEGRVMRDAEVRRKKGRTRQWYEQGGEQGGAGDGIIHVEPVHEIGLSNDLVVPLLYAPLMPLLVIALRGRVPPEKLHKVAGGVIGFGLLHAGTVMFTDSSIVMD